MILSRRRFFGLLAAPAIVHIGNLMPVKASPRGDYLTMGDFSDLKYQIRTSIPTGAWRTFNQGVPAADKTLWLEAGKWL